MTPAQDEPLFAAPQATITTFNLDLAAAGIPKRDEHDRMVDIHALRHTFGTHLRRARVPSRAAQAAMRQSSIGLTMDIYADPTWLGDGGVAQAEAAQLLS